MPLVQTQVNREGAATEKMVTVYLKGPQSVGINYNGTQHYGSIYCDRAFAQTILNRKRGSLVKPINKPNKQPSK